MAREITYNNFEISLTVFMPNITTNHAIICLYDYQQKVYNFHMKVPVFQIKLKYHCSKPIKLQKFLTSIIRETLDSETYQVQLSKSYLLHLENCK